MPRLTDEQRQRLRDALQAELARAYADALGRGVRPEELERSLDRRVAHLRSTAAGQAAGRLEEARDFPDDPGHLGRILE